jgi:hypothetical protein
MVKGIGLGFRREMSSEIDLLLKSDVDFLEVAPENWMRLGGEFEELLTSVTKHKPLVCHGLSLSIGSPDPLDTKFVRELGEFFTKHKVQAYSEHLSFCSANGHMYDLMPLPFTEGMVQHVVDRVKRVQDILQMNIALENVSYYLSLNNQMSELEFLLQVLERADCQLLLDVNNVYVNSINHNYEPKSFIEALPSSRIVYGHIAGHYDEADDLKVDTHGSDVIEPVWELLRHSYRVHGVFPTLLERDFNIPSMEVLIEEAKCIGKIQSSFAKANKVA